MSLDKSIDEIAKEKLREFEDEEEWLEEPVEEVDYKREHYQGRNTKDSKVWKS